MTLNLRKFVDSCVPGLPENIQFIYKTDDQSIYTIIGDTAVVCQLDPDSTAGHYILDALGK